MWVRGWPPLYMDILESHKLLSTKIAVTRKKSQKKLHISIIFIRFAAFLITL